MQEVNKAWLEFLREQYPAGSRIRLRELKDTYRQMEAGSEGTLVAIDDIGTFHVKWDNGSTLGLVIGEDSFTVLPPEAQTVKLQNAEQPVGQINYLAYSGKVRESIAYSDEKKFIEDIMHSNYYGEPITVEVFKDQAGKSISLDFIERLDPPVQVRVVPYVEQKTEANHSEIPDASIMKLYMPLCADLFERNYNGDMEDDPYALDGKEIAGYTDKIMSAILNNRMPVEAERGIMHWYHEHDEVERKVRSVVFNVEPRDGELWGVAECLIIGELKPEEMDTLKEYITGQASDGWGEGFEQREIEVEEGELYVHLWNGDAWSLQTEEERFGPKLADGLPEMCFSVLLSTGELICIKRGVSGYYRSDWSTDSREENERLANDCNEQLGVSSAQRHAMESGSMFGWNTPGADPSTYEQRQQMGGMDLG